MFQQTIAPGIVIRQFELTDAVATYSVVDRNRAYLRQWMPWVDATDSPAVVREFITRTICQRDADQGPQAGIWVDQQLSGSVGCHPIDWANRNCSIGYWIDASLQGRGIITRCVIAMLDHLFQEKRLHRVEIRCGTRNFKSCAIPDRLGFVREGVARNAEWVNDRWVDLVVWSMLEDDWQASARDRSLSRT